MMEILKGSSQKQMKNGGIRLELIGSNGMTRFFIYQLIGNHQLSSKELDLSEIHGMVIERLKFLAMELRSNLPWALDYWQSLMPKHPPMDRAEYHSSKDKGG